MPHHQKNLSYKPVFVRFLEDVKIDVKIAYSTWCATLARLCKVQIVSNL
ncbi:MAG: hypothetical protein MR897_07280 [Bacteroidales bacterium]|nr:hypothetical protein [Muribaculaceae bacterium]MCI6335230.1 hypothetical protein [Bacteroidales bacterium]MDY3736713.1 hypothetical protein [Sodaliphilus sp.]MCI7033210.1 hypothetical protein [Bacteroidales bacterium]MCI7471346.1 hypothetical protein [Bacteroidales bacterium]